MITDEQAVIAAVLMNSRVLRFAAAECTPDDFSDGRLGAIFNGMAVMYGQREPIDVLTVAPKLAGWTRGISIADLHSWMGELPTAENVAWYAGHVREAGMRRSLSEVAVRLQQQSQKDDPGWALANAQKQLIAIRDNQQTTAMQPVPLGNILEGEDDYDWVIDNLLERGDRMLLTGVEGGGKALAVDTPIATPSGWSTMGELVVGDSVFSADGSPTRVIAATETMTDRPCYRVTFSDGSQIIADAQHQWLTETLASRHRSAQQRKRGETRARGTDQRSKRKHVPTIVTTQEISETLTVRDGHAVNHSVPLAAPVQYSEQKLLVDPYVLGAWLGDGHSGGARLTCAVEDIEIVERIRAAGIPCRKAANEFGWSLSDGSKRGPQREKLQGQLRLLGVFGNKHIPDVYLRGSVAQRLALLQGLMDTDGTVDVRSHCEFSVTSQALADGVHELLLSLGIKVRIQVADATLNGRVVGLRWRLMFQTELPVFHLRRKAERIVPAKTQRAFLRYIVAVEPIKAVPVRCIEVEHVSHLFLAGREFIPTHNSTLVRQMAIMSAAGIHPFTFRPMKPARVLIVDSENSEKQWRRAARPLVLKAATRGSLNPAEVTRIICAPRLDLSKDQDLGQVHRMIDEHKPDILFIGPLYRLIPRAINSDDDAAPLLAALDTLRERGLALVIEAHAGHAVGSGGVRDLRPRGSAALLGWPEFGLGLQVDKGGRSSNEYQLLRWRGDRDQRKWPTRISRGISDWPWTPTVAF